MQTDPTASNIRKLTLVCDENYCERLYVDGVVSTKHTDDMLYASELIYATEGKPCILQGVEIEHSHAEWPQTLEEALKAPKQGTKYA